MDDQALASCQREIQRLRGLVRIYGEFYDKVKAICDNPKLNAEEVQKQIEELVFEYR